MMKVEDVYLNYKTHKQRFAFVVREYLILESGPGKPVVDDLNVNLAA